MECRKRLSPDMLEVLDRFDNRISGIFDPAILKKAIGIYKADPTEVRCFDKIDLFNS